jgi:pyruvate/2-oxoglutarate dehydrogenase complex dihydrolipoamide acyltransferase (E2) component
LLEIETDKVAYGIESPVAGIVKAILANVGDEVPVGNIVAVIGGVDEKIDLQLYQKQQNEISPSVLVQTEVPKESVSIPSQRLSTGPRGRQAGFCLQRTSMICRWRGTGWQLVPCHRQDG